MWYSVAETHSPGDVQWFAANHRALIERLMTLTQIAEANKLAREWKPKAP